MKAHVRFAALCLIGCEATYGPAFAADLEWQARLSPRLLSIWTAAQPVAADAAAETAASTPAIVTGRFDAQGRLQIDVAYDCTASALRVELQELGMVESTTLDAPPTCVIEGWSATGSLPAIASVAGVTKIDLPRYARHQGAVAKRHGAR